MDEEQRRFVHEQLTRLQKVRNLGSVNRAIGIIEEEWKRGDLNVGGNRWKGRRRELISLA